MRPNSSDAQFVVPMGLIQAGTVAALDHSRGSWRGRDFHRTEYVDAIRATSTNLLSGFRSGEADRHHHRGRPLRTREAGSSLNWINNLRRSVASELEPDSNSPVCGSEPAALEASSRQWCGPQTEDIARSGDRPSIPGPAAVSTTWTT